MFLRWRYPLLRAPERPLALEEAVVLLGWPEMCTEEATGSRRNAPLARTRPSTLKRTQEEKEGWLPEVWALCERALLALPPSAALLRAGLAHGLGRVVARCTAAVGETPALMDACRPQKLIAVELTSSLLQLLRRR